jgi:hypothetical protein
LRPEHYFVLLRKLKLIHDNYCNTTLALTDEHLKSFILGSLKRPGANQNLSPREMIKRFLDAISILSQNPAMSVDQVLNNATSKERSQDDIKQAKSDEELEPEPAQSDPMSRFEKA